MYCTGTVLGEKKFMFKDKVCEIIHNIWIWKLTLLSVYSDFELYTSNAWLLVLGEKNNLPLIAFKSMYKC